MALAALSGAFLDFAFVGCHQLLVKPAAGWIQSHFGYSLDPRLGWICSVQAMLSWFQPVVLRLGAVRVALWIAVYVLLGAGLIFSLDRAPGMYSVRDLIVIGHWFGVPGMVVIGARTHPWQSFVGAAAALGLLALFGWKALSFGSGSMVSGLILANLPYAAVMLYGTERCAGQEVPLRTPAVSPSGR
jgi:hypothetical protein